ncbi:Cytochrome P450 2U1 [Hypsibius exemplaris]|uniref:Cytochrome P450 2U1 n=1 Tax=Hypsibius exemplaris TaxID=2072580 RepID=A0A1W0WLJ1_HYPEX|nr:Cytochrome P450 2U1 [Hypsibius exemplaris]
MLWSITVAVCILFLTYKWIKTSRPKNIPPGPTAIPLLGNLLSMGRRPEYKVLEWKKKYGDIFSMYSGRKLAVVLSDFYTVRKVFNEDVAAGRPTNNPSRNDYPVRPDGLGLLACQGELWKVHRRFALSTLRDLGMGKNWLEDTIIAEVEGLCQAMRDTKQQPFNPKVPVTNSVSNVICALSFGQRFELTDPKFSRLTMLIAKIISAIKLDYVMANLPFLQWFPNPIRSGIAQARRNRADLLAFFREKIHEHNAAACDPSTGLPDYLYAYQHEKETGEKTDVPELFTEAQLTSSLYDLFIAGTDTTSTTILLAMILMVENPEVVKKAQEEIDTTFGRETVLTYSDRARLPYTEATIMEIQRYGSIVPLNVPHKANEDLQIDGYTIPKGTLLVANALSIHRDPRWWNNPDEFDPTRFLDSNGKLTKPDGFLPFCIDPPYIMTAVKDSVCSHNILADIKRSNK